MCNREKDKTCLPPESYLPGRKMQSFSIQCGKKPRFGGQRPSDLKDMIRISKQRKIKRVFQVKSGCFLRLEETHSSAKMKKFSDS
jgi:hypothetical protein